MKEEKIKEPLPLGVIKGAGYLPIDFDMNIEVYSYRFWLMCKLRFPYCESFQRRHDIYLETLKKTLFDAYPDSRIVDRTVTRIVTQAYNTIPGVFWSNLEKRSPLPESKNKSSLRVGRTLERRESYIFNEQPKKKSKKKSKKK